MSPSKEWLERSGDGAKEGEEYDVVLSFPSEIGWIGGGSVSSGDVGLRVKTATIYEAKQIIAFKKCADLEAPSDVIVCGEFGDI